jgi:hypothetical protein
LTQRLMSAVLIPVRLDIHSVLPQKDLPVDGVPKLASLFYQCEYRPGRVSESADCSQHPEYINVSEAEADYDNASMCEQPLHLLYNT